MAFARPSMTMMKTILARRGLVGITQATTRTFGRRTYASEAHGHTTKAGSDLPWIIGSVGFTVPVCAYLLSGSSDAGHHNVHEATHKVKHAVEENIPESTEDAKAKGSKIAEKAKAKADESVKAVKGKFEGAKDSIDSTDDVKEKAKEAYETAKEKASSTTEDLKERASSATEAVKEGASNAGEKESQTEKAPPSATDPPSDVKDPKSTNEMSGKQEKLTNAPTFHSTLHTERGQAMSKKPEGSVQSAKLKGTVDPSR